MTHKSIITAVVIAATATPLMAQDITGASLEGVFRQYSDDEVDSSVVSLNGGIEIGFGQFALGGNLEVLDGDDFGEGASSGTLHAMYNFSPNSAIGLFAGAESNDNVDATSYGIEIGGGSVSTSYQAYYGIVDSDDFGDDDISIAGFNVEVPVSTAFAVGIDYSSFTIDDAFLPAGTTETEDLTFSDTALFARYTFAEGASAFAQIGQISASARSGDTIFVSTNDVQYFAIGAQYTFGRSGGNIFDNRSFSGFGG